MARLILNFFIFTFSYFKIIAATPFSIGMNFGLAQERPRLKALLANQDPATGDMVTSQLMKRQSANSMSGFFEAVAGWKFYQSDTLSLSVQVTYHHDPYIHKKTTFYQGSLPNIVPILPPFILRQEIVEKIKVPHWYGVSLEMQLPLSERYAIITRAGIRQATLTALSKVYDRDHGTFHGQAKIRKPVTGIHLESGLSYQMNDHIQVIGTVGYFGVLKSHYPSFYPEPEVRYQPTVKIKRWQGTVGIRYLF